MAICTPPRKTCPRSVSHAPYTAPEHPRDEVQQPGTGPAVLVAGQVDHAGEHPRATRARIDVVPHAGGTSRLER